MAKIDDIIISQQEIDYLFAQPKILDFRQAVWRKKQEEQPYPYWLHLNLPFFDQHQMPIEQLRACFKYRPARRMEITPSMNFIAFYKNRRIYAVDQGNNLVHYNRFTDVQPIAEPCVKGCHFHLLHEKYNQETGYRFDQPIVKADDFSFFMCYFLQKFNVTALGDIPHPIESNHGQLELLL